MTEMSNFLLFLSFVPLIGVNFWHSFLLFKHSKDDRPHSISHHAAESSEWLHIHRLVHTSASVLLIAFAAGFLIPGGYMLAAYSLIAAAVFDVLEVFTLNKRNAVEALSFNSHTATAWPMALFYLLYATTIITVVNLNPLFVMAIWLTPAILAVLFALRKFKGFWITQHVYFCLLALVLIVAHIRLLG